MADKAVDPLTLKVPTPKGSVWFWTGQGPINVEVGSPTYERLTEQHGMRPGRQPTFADFEGGAVTYDEEYTAGDDEPAA